MIEVTGPRTVHVEPWLRLFVHGALIIPFFRKVRFLTLAMCEFEVEEKCVTQQGITLNVRSVIALRSATTEDGLGEIATGLVGQGLAIFDSLRTGTGQQTAGAPNGERSVLELKG